MIDYMYKLMNLDRLRVQKVPYMKFSVIIKWGQVWRVPAGQKGSLPTLVAYPNKTETLILDDRLYIYIGNVCPAEKHTKCSSVLLLRLVRFSAWQILWRHKIMFFHLSCPNFW